MAEIESQNDILEITMDLNRENLNALSNMFFRN